MSKETMKIHNVTTGEIIEREETADETAQRLETLAQAKAAQAEAEAKATAKVELLAKLGITADEAALLLG